MPTLIASATGIDQRLRALLRCDIAGDHLHRVGQPLDAVDGFQHARGGGHARCRTHDQVHAGIDQPLGALIAALSRPWSRPRPAAGPATSLQASGWATAFSMSFTVIRADARDIARRRPEASRCGAVQHPLGLVLADALAHRDEVFMRQSVSEIFCFGSGGKPHVAVGEDADQLAGRILGRAGDDGNAGKSRCPSSSVSASDRVASGPMVSGCDTPCRIPYFFTCRTCAAWPSGSKLRVDDADARPPAPWRSPCAPR